MTLESTFRLVFIVYGFAFLPFGLYCRIRSRTGEGLDRWQEGVIILFGLRLTAVALFAGSMAWMIDPAWMSWAEVPIPVWLRWMGLAMVGLGGTLMVWTFQCLGRNLTDTVVTRRVHFLVTIGPYRWVRHPFYAACAMGSLGGSLATANWFILVTTIIVLGFLVARTRIEEEKLVGRFGDDYRVFMKRVGRFVPRLRR